MTRIRPYLAALNVARESLVIAAVRNLLTPDQVERWRPTNGAGGPLIAAPVTGQTPRPGSRIGPQCQRCGRHVWVGPETLTLGISYLATVCLECLAREVERVTGEGGQ